MSNNFKIIYKILKTLEKAMDYEEPDLIGIGYVALGISETRWKAIIEMLVECGYVKGISVSKSFSGIEILLVNPKITLKGLEYLEENSLMAKAKELAKGLIEVAK